MSYEDIISSLISDACEAEELFGIDECERFAATKIVVRKCNVRPVTYRVYVNGKLRDSRFSKGLAMATARTFNGVIAYDPNPLPNTYGR